MKLTRENSNASAVYITEKYIVEYMDKTLKAKVVSFISINILYAFIIVVPS